MYTSTRDSTHERNTGLHLTLDRWVGILFEFYELLNGLLCLSVGKHENGHEESLKLPTDDRYPKKHAARIVLSVRNVENKVGSLRQEYNSQHKVLQEHLEVNCIFNSTFPFS